MLAKAFIYVLNEINKKVCIEKKGNRKSGIEKKKGGGSKKLI